MQDQRSLPHAIDKFRSDGVLTQAHSDVGESWHTGFGACTKHLQAMCLPASSTHSLQRQVAKWTMREGTQTLSGFTKRVSSWTLKAGLKSNSFCR